MKSVGLISHVRLEKSPEERWAVCGVLCAKSVFPALFTEAVMKRAAGELRAGIFTQLLFCLKLSVKAFGCLHRCESEFKCVFRRSCLNRHFYSGNSQGERNIENELPSALLCIIKNLFYHLNNLVFRIQIQKFMNI